MNTARTKEKPKFLDRLSAFLAKYRLALLIILITIAVGAVTLFVVLQVTSNQQNKAFVRIEALQKSYGDWLALGNDEQAAQYDDFESKIQDVLGSYSRGYARERALFIYAESLGELKRWDESLDRYTQVADEFGETYLAPISLTLAAVAAENAGRPEDALAILNRLIDTYDSSNSEIPRALFSVGRINESLDNVADAALSYNRLIDEHPGSSWTNLARARIITLTVQGRIGS